MTGTLRTLHIPTTKEAGAEMLRRVDAYLYEGWTAELRAHTMIVDGEDVEVRIIVVNGKDVAGWTAESLNDRLWSGLIPAKVVR